MKFSNESCVSLFEVSHQQCQLQGIMHPVLLSSPLFSLGKKIVTIWQNILHVKFHIVPVIVTYTVLAGPSRSLTLIFTEFFL